MRSRYTCGEGGPSLLEIAITCAVVLFCVGIHYETLGLCSRLLPHLPGKHRFRVAFTIVTALVGHVTEILLFAAAIALCQLAGIGELAPPTTAFRDVFYFSAVSYTSLGIGDIAPIGRMRLLVSVEALTGLMMIAWTASFTYVQMERFWDDR